ncbi:hypothetical protein NFI96_011984 [Prochilodus magdalenae]|nr:hypothetical protein NFI96_011984 [Prochilodus magdalenae]
MTVWYDTTAVFGDGDVVLRTVVVTVCVHVVLRGAAVCRWCCTNRMTHGGRHCSLELAMAGYQGDYLQRFQNYLERSGEHKVIQKLIDTVLRPDTTKIADGKTGFKVLGVGSGGGEMDVYLISNLQAALPSIPISVDVVEPSTDLTQSFKVPYSFSVNTDLYVRHSITNPRLWSMPVALVARTSSLQGVPFSWNIVTCAEYEQQVKTKEDTKFDLIHMIQMLYYVDDPAATLKFFHSILKDNGKLLIIHEAANSGFEVLWKTFKKELCTNTLSDYMSAGDIKVHLDALGLRYEELVASNTLDITECFTEGSRDGEMLLDFMTDRENFRTSFSDEVRSGMLELLRNECSTTIDGRVLFNCSLSALLVHA